MYEKNRCENYKILTINYMQKIIMNIWQKNVHFSEVRVKGFFERNSLNALLLSVLKSDFWLSLVNIYYYYHNSIYLHLPIFIQDKNRTIASFLPFFKVEEEFDFRTTFFVP